MELLQEDNKLTIQEDSITVVVNSLREIYRNGSEDSSSSREKIISLENELFELRARKAVLIDKINVIEQEWVLNNMEHLSTGEPEQTKVLLASDIDANYIFESPNVRENLSDIDYQNLIKSEELESKAQELSNTYIINHDNMLSLSRSYSSTPLQSDAIDIKTKFDSLSMANVQILEQLGDTWGYIYDNKSFAYSLLMELLGFDDVLQQEAELMRASQAEISSKMDSNGAEELLQYQIQKSSMVEFEILVAQKLGLEKVTRSLSALSDKLSASQVALLPKLSIEERLFILYEPIEFVTKPLYTASNPVPQTVIYEKGVIFRLYVGSFQAKQTVATFRNTTPLSCMLNDKNRYCYYIGGFETLEQAEEGQALLKKRGFRAPQIVVWSDGRERNLTTDPLPLSSSYRLEIIEASTLPQGATQVVSRVAPSSSISKVGTDKFIIMSLQRSSQADSLANELRAIDPELKISIEKSEAKIEF
ncbi:MAG: hypothetical protein SNF93_05320 [Rikenellaceae bacterium]